MKVEAEEFKRVVLEIIECLEQGAMTPSMMLIKEQYKKEIN